MLVLSVECLLKHAAQGPLHITTPEDCILWLSPGGAYIIAPPSGEYCEATVYYAEHGQRVYCIGDTDIGFPVTMPQEVLDIIYRIGSIL